VYGLTVEAAPPGVQINPKTRAVVVNVPIGIVLAEIDLPVRQTGVVYDAYTREALPGASLRLLGPNGQPVPAAQLLAGQQDQTVVASGPVKGCYRFDLINTAPAGVYTLQITPPAGYTAPSKVLPPSGLLAQPATSQLTVVPNSLPPKGSEPTTYYLQLTLNPAANRARVVHNHLPLDPSSISQLALQKSVNVSEAEIGDVVRYTLRIHNLSPVATLSGVTVADTLPKGFKFVPRTARLIAGATPTVLPEPAGSPGPNLVFTLGNLAADQTVEINYHVRLGVGATEGDGINRAQAQGQAPGGPLSSLIAQARVTVGGGVFRSEACLIGKIYMDCGNSVGQGGGNGIQDVGELGIPGVRFYLEDGTSITSDSEGKYSFCGLSPRTHVMKADNTTLPHGARLGTTSNRNGGDPGSLFLDLKKGELHPADFRDMSCHPAVLKEVQQRRDRLKSKNQNSSGDVRVPEVGKPASRTGPGLGLERKAPSASASQGGRP
jgi:large repetitive protein